MRFIVILFTALSFYLSGAAQKSIYIYGTVKGLPVNQFPVNQFNYATQDINIIATVPIDSTGHYGTSVRFDPSRRLTICWVDVFATPGDSVELNFEAYGNSESIQATAKGKNAPGYLYLYWLQKLEPRLTLERAKNLNERKAMVSEYARQKAALADSLQRALRLPERFYATVKKDLRFEEFNLLASPVFVNGYTRREDYPGGYFSKALVQFCKANASLRTTASTQALFESLILFDAHLKGPLYSDYENFQQLARAASLKKDIAVRDYLWSCIVSSFMRNRKESFGTQFYKDVQALAEKATTPEYRTLLQRASYNTMTLQEKALKVRLLSPGGDTLTLQQLLQRYPATALYLDFWASWCKPCVQEFPYLQNRLAAFNKSGVQYVGISVDKDIAAWKKALERYGQGSNEHYRVVEEDSRALQEAFGADAIPKYVMVRAPNAILFFNAPRPSEESALSGVLNMVNNTAPKPGMAPPPPPPAPPSNE